MNRSKLANFKNCDVIIDDTIDNKIEENNNNLCNEKIKRKNNFPLSNFHGNCLCFSSLFFLIPSYYGFNNNLKYYGLLSLVTSIISINFWRDTTELGFRRNLDSFFAKVSFMVYFITGINYINDSSVYIIGWLICFCILLCFYLSHRQWNKDEETWIIFHMLFHFFVAIEKFIVLYYSIM
jgi:hypothetical protein